MEEINIILFDRLRALGYTEANTYFSIIKWLAETYDINLYSERTPVSITRDEISGKWIWHITFIERADYIESDDRGREKYFNSIDEAMHDGLETAIEYVENI